MSQLWVIKASHPLTAERGSVQLSGVLEDTFLLSACAGKSQALSKPRSLEELLAYLLRALSQRSQAWSQLPAAWRRWGRVKLWSLKQRHIQPWDRKERKGWTPGNLRVKGGMRVVAVTFPAPKGMPGFLYSQEWAFFWGLFELFTRIPEKSLGRQT